MRFFLYINIVMLHLDLTLSGDLGHGWTSGSTMNAPTASPQKPPEQTVVRHICSRRIQGYVQKAKWKNILWQKPLMYH